MKYTDFYHIPVAGDGSCFFHSISGINHLNEHLWPLLNSKPITYKIESSKWDSSSLKIRKQCVEWLEKNLNYRIKGTGMSIRDEILEDVQNNDNIKDKTVNGYLSYMKKRNSYAGQIEIYAIAELLNNNGKEADFFYVSNYTKSFEESAKFFFKKDVKLEEKNLWA